MGYLWYRTDAAEGHGSPTRRSHPWGVRLKDGSEWYVTRVVIHDGITVNDGRQHGLPVDHAMSFTDEYVELIDPISAL